MNHLYLKYLQGTGVAQEKIQQQMKNLDGLRRSDLLGEIPDYVEWLESRVEELERNAKD